MQNATVEFVRARVENYATHEDAGKMLEQYDQLSSQITELVHVAQDILSAGLTEQSRETLTYALAAIPEEFKVKST